MNSISGDNKWLCMDCMEARIGHKLINSEILPCPITEYMIPYTMSILNNEYNIYIKNIYE